MDIRCRKTDCRYNDKLTCRAKDIKVSKKTVCEDFSFEEGKELDISKKIFESDTPPKVAPYRHNKKLCIDCDAKCLFNQNNQCIANGITMGDISKCAKCITFMKP